MNYKNLADNIRQQINPETLPLDKEIKEAFNAIAYSDVLTFIKTAMMSVGPEYTKRTMEAGNKVKDHLERKLESKEFKRQGSVMTDTHIKGHSDVDLLVISTKSYSWNSRKITEALNTQSYKHTHSEIEKLRKEVSYSKYGGNQLDDLKKLRTDSESTLSNIYIECDTSKPKAIKIKNRSLNREVDIVVACWYDDLRSVLNDKGDYRGINVYNKEEHKKGAVDFPFLSIKRINERSASTNGRLKKMIRFMKNVKAHSGYDIKLSSFDINAICYDIRPTDYINLPYYGLVSVIYNKLYKICTETDHANSIKSVDEREYIFLGNPEKLEDLRILMTLIQSVYNDLQKEFIYG